MSEPEKRRNDAAQVERRRARVKALHVGDQLTYPVIVERLAAEGITTTTATVCRDVKVIQREFAAGVSRDPLVSIGQRSHDFRVVFRRSMRAAGRTKDDGAKARLLRVAVHALQAECELLQTCGLLPRDLGRLRVEQLQPAERIPTGEELQRRFDSVRVTDDEITSEAERAWLYGDAHAADAAARGEKKPH